MLTITWEPQIFRLENPEGLRRKCRTLAKWIGEANHVVIFTGPGISVAAGIPDTVKPHAPESTSGNKVAKAVPTVAHMALAKLASQQAVDYIITTCLDGLHAKAGTPASSLSELHGNHFQEFCTKCGRMYIRDHKVRTSHKATVHTTGRKCPRPSCGGALRDCIVSTGEFLPEIPIRRAITHAFRADLLICIGEASRCAHTLR